MRLTSTEFRKNLFQIVERVLQGESVEVTHKGKVIRLTPGEPTSKMSRLVVRDTLNCPPDRLDDELRRLRDEMNAAAENKWAERL